MTMPLSRPDPADGTSAGRFAPSPTGDLHLGNLRTALLAWLFARSTGRRFLLRIEDLDQVRAGSAEQQLHDLAAIGLDWDEPIVYQSERYDRYDEALEQLTSAGLTYECFCSRKDIAEAASAPQTSIPQTTAPQALAPPHAAATGAPSPASAVAPPPRPPRAYPGTCRDLSDSERAERRATGRPAAIRLRAAARAYSITDIVIGDYTGYIDDLALRRNDGTVAYNLAVVVDDAAQGIDQVVRGDDLLQSAPSQAYLAELLGLPQPTYAHVPLVLGPTGRRLAKRDGAVTLADLAQERIAPADVVSILAWSLDMAHQHESVTTQQLLSRFDPSALPAHPWTLDPTVLADLV